MDMEDTATTKDNFKEVFKYYKRRKPPPDMSNVLHIGDTFQEGVQILPCPLTNLEEEESEALGLIPHKLWKIWNFNDHPGLLFIQNPFSSKGQLRWIYKCLTEFPSPPNNTNLESHGVTQSNALWWEQATSAEGKEANIKNLLRWVTLGYHHNWDTKEYSEDMRGVMPDDLVKLCSIVGKVLGFEHFRAEAAIINFYHQNSTLGPHTDHSEPNMAAPLFSLSFGQSAVFLIGGASKEIKPTALYLHSGDIIIMSGDSRLAYHAVPRVVLRTDKPWIAEDDKCYDSLMESNSLGGSCKKVSDTNDNEHSEQMIDIFDYVRANRINMNVRQVLLPSMQHLPN